MLSTKTHVTITDVTREALAQIGGNAIVDRVIEVEVIQEMLLASSLTEEDHESKLATALRRLLRMVEQHGKFELAETLKALMRRIDGERSRPLPLRPTILIPRQPARETN